MYLSDNEFVKLIVTLVTECRYKFLIFLDEIRRSLEPAKKNPGLFPDFMNFLDTIRRYYVPVKKNPDWSSYFYDNMEYPLKHMKWMFSTKTGLCMTAGLSLYLIYRRNRTEKTLVAGSLIAYAMKDTSMMRGPLQYINSLFPFTRTEIFVIAGLTLYFLYRNNKREKICIAGCLLTYGLRDFSVVKVPMQCVQSLLSTSMQVLESLPFIVLTGGLTMYFLFRESNTEKELVAISLLAYWLRETSLMQYVISMVCSRCGILVVTAAAGVTIYLVFFRKKKKTPFHGYPSLGFDDSPLYFHEDDYHREDLYRNDLYEEIINVPSLRAPMVQPSDSFYYSLNQDQLNNFVFAADEIHSALKPKKKRRGKKKKGELLDIAPKAGVPNSPKQLQHSINNWRNDNVAGLSNIDANNCQCNVTKWKKGKCSHAWPFQSIQLNPILKPSKDDDNLVKTNADCVQKQQSKQMLKSSGNVFGPSNGERKQDKMSVSDFQKQQSNQPNIKKPSKSKKQDNGNPPNFHNQKSNQSNVQKHQNNQLDNTANVPGPSNVRGIQDSGNPTQQSYPEKFQKEQSNQLDNLPGPSNSTGTQDSNKLPHISLRRRNDQTPTPNVPQRENFVIRLKLD